MDDFEEMIERTFGVKRREVESTPPTAAPEASAPPTAASEGSSGGEGGSDNVDSASEVPAAANRRPWLIAGGVTAGLAVVGGALYYRARKTGLAPTVDPPKANPTTSPVEPTPDPPDTSDPTLPSKLGQSWWSRVPGLPESTDVPGFDLETNWGSTPRSLRPLFALMERVSLIDGSARIFALISFREAGFKPTAHNDSESEVDGSRRGYKNARDRNRPLKFGDASGEFGSGGLFGALAPYFLWTGVQELKSKAPLLSAPPEVMFIPRVAAFGAVVYMQRLLKYYQIDDHADIKAGWASPTLLKGGRGGTTYAAVRTRFYSDAVRLGLDLEDTTTIPKDLSSAQWPGVATAFEGLTAVAVDETVEG